MSKNKILFIFILSFNISFIFTQTSEKHLVNDLFNGLYKKEIYSGYLKTDIEDTELFYIFTPSQSSPENDPIILWLNGGPGCSSTTGLFEEIGPVLFIPNKKEPILNEYAWNKNASVIFIESPGGVGFSKLKNPNFFYNDEIQAVSLNIAIQNFFKIFPEYKKNIFYITGESYAGTYIPHLVIKMFKYMDENKDAIKLNLKGFLIGNPYSFEDTDFEDSMIEFFFSHALLSFETYEKYMKECPHWPQIEKIYFPYEEKKDYKFEPIIDNFIYPWKNVTRTCNEARYETAKAINGINGYGILKECPSNDTIFKLRKEFNNINYDETNLHSEQNVFIKKIRQNINNKYRRYTGLYLNNNNSNSSNETEFAENYLSGCGNSYYTSNFLNDNITKEKLGVDKSIIHYSCADLYYKWGDSMNYYKNDIKELSKNKNFTSWLFSGTEDVAVATLGTLRFLNELNYTIKEKWKKWKVDGQIAGMEQTYDYNLKFITVKGVGHMVPEDNPKVAKVLLDNFLAFNKYEPKTENDSFPVWAIALISIVSFLIILAVIIIIIRVKRRKDSVEDIEEQGKLIPG